MSPEVIVDKGPGLAARAVERIANAARQGLTGRGRFALALPGGSVATALFPGLAAAAVEWAGADFFWGDERAVAPTHPDSNYGVAKSLWLEPARVPTERVHRMAAERPDLQAAADDYARALIRAVGDPPALDLALLGVGPDGHVCSLFPNHPALREEFRWVAAIADSPKPPAARLTLTLPALSRARWVVVVATGAPKAPAIAEALRRPDSQLPVALVARRAAHVTFVLDDDAASALPGR